MRLAPINLNTVCARCLCAKKIGRRNCHTILTVFDKEFVAECDVLGETHEVRSTALEARWAGEMARATASLSPREGVDLLQKIEKAKREPDPPSASFRELYDQKTLSPVQEAVDHYKKFTRIFKDLGLDYPTWNH